MANISESRRQERDLVVLREQANIVSLNSQYGIQGGISNFRRPSPITQEHGRLLREIQDIDISAQEMYPDRINSLDSLRANFPKFVDGYLSETVEEGQENTENIPEDKEVLSIKFKKNKKGITLNVPKLAPIVTIYNLQDDIVLIDTSTLENNEYMTRTEFEELSSTSITTKDPVILKSNYYISETGIAIHKNRVKANCFRDNNKFKVTEEEFFDGTLSKRIEKAKKAELSQDPFFNNPRSIF